MMVIKIESFSGICSSPVDGAHFPMPRWSRHRADRSSVHLNLPAGQHVGEPGPAKIPTPDFGGIEVRGTTSIRHASVGSTEASDGRLARGGRIDRSNLE